MRGALPTAGIARVVAYTFDRGPSRSGSTPAPAECNDEGFLPFRRDGTLCPSVLAPGAVLDSDEVRRVVAIVTAADEALAAAKKSGHYARAAHLRCGFDAHHALGFYDARGALRARIALCFTLERQRLRWRRARYITLRLRMSLRFSESPSAGGTTPPGPAAAGTPMTRCYRS